MLPIIMTLPTVTFYMPLSIVLLCTFQAKFLYGDSKNSVTCFQIYRQYYFYSLGNTRIDLLRVIKINGS